MANATIRWISGKKFIGTDSTNHSVVISTPDEGIGMKPSELLLVALASCTAVDVVEILHKKRVDLTGLEISASGEQQADPPWTFRKVHLVYRIHGKGITPEAAEMAVRLSEEKYCSVSATIRGVAEITTEIIIVPQDEALITAAAVN